MENILPEENTDKELEAVVKAMLPLVKNDVRI
jgi:hypothetical protein